MNSLQPLIRKVNHIEGFRFHPEDTQNEIFDIFVHQMKICEGVDEHGEKCEYMYIHSKDGNVYKAILLPTDFINNSVKSGSFKEILTLPNIIESLHRKLDLYIDMIPTRMVGNIAMDFVEKYKKGFFLYYAFKCRAGRISHVRHYISILQTHANIVFDEDITKEIDTFNHYYGTRRESRGGTTKGIVGYDDSLPGVTKEDIEQGNQILKKLIAYLENQNELK